MAEAGGSSTHRHARSPIYSDEWLIHLFQIRYGYDQLLDPFEHLLGLDFVDRLSISITDIALDALGYPPASTVAATDEEIFSVSRDWFYDSYCERITTGSEAELREFLHYIRTDPRVSMQGADIRMVADVEIEPEQALYQLLRQLYDHDLLLWKARERGLDLSRFRIELLELVFDAYGLPETQEARGPLRIVWAQLVESKDAADFTMFLDAVRDRAGA